MKKITNSIACLLLLSSLQLVKAQTAYKSINKIKLEGDGGWDFLSADESAARLYVSHSSKVQVVDLKTGNLVGTIPDTKGVHGITIAQDLNKGFISNGKDSSVTVFDITTLATLAKVQVTGKKPDAILYDKFSHKVFVFNAGSNNATVLDAKTNAIVASIAFEGNPEVAVSDEKGKVYVNIESTATVDVINASTLKTEASWKLDKGEEPTGLALDIKHQRLFSVCANKLMVILDAANGKVITSLPIGEGVDGVAFDAEKERAYSSNGGDGTITVVEGKKGDNYKVLETITTQKGAKTIAIDTKRRHIYTPTAEIVPAPEATPENPKPRPSIKPGSFFVFDIQL